MDPIKAGELLEKYLEGTATPEEIILVDRWYESLTDPADAQESGDQQAIGEQLRSQILTAMREEEGTARPPHLLRRILLAGAVAALFAGAIVTVWYWRKQAATTKIDAMATARQIGPGADKAILTLSGGKQIILDKTANGHLAQQGGTEIYQPGKGQLAYREKDNGSATISQNTLTTQRGAQYQLTLPDGSRAWLNASSSISYPTSFRGTRTVTVTGEVYFEIAQDKNSPFHVQAGKADILVLGTHFNVNAYDDETDTRTALLQGSVKVKSGSQEQILAPGQQAMLDHATARLSVEPVDTMQAVAWKNGFFAFKDAHIQTVMRQIARWYDITVEYKGTFSGDDFNGKAPRGAALSSVLEMLQLTGAVRFSVEGKTVTVTPGDAHE